MAVINILPNLRTSRPAYDRRQPRRNRAVPARLVVDINEKRAMDLGAGIAAIVVALILAEDGLNVPSSTFGFPLIAFGVATMLVTAVSPELPFSRIPLPGAAFLATIAYSIYLSHKLVIHALQNACSALSVPLISWRCYLCMLAAILLAGSVLFFAIERPFLLLRQRYVRRQRAAGLHRANAARS